MPLSEIKCCGAVPSFYIKMMKRRTLQACSLKHSIQKDMFCVLGKMNLFRSGKGKSSPPPLLGYASENYTVIAFKKTYINTYIYICIHTCTRNHHMCITFCLKQLSKSMLNETNLSADNFGLICIGFTESNMFS